MAPPTGAIEPTLEPPESGVTVRMYNVGFGDCFLMAFRAEDGKARYMLIDCGGNAQLGKVAADIAKATGNHLHVVAVTHEHGDHYAGFFYFEQSMQIDQLWLAWPENSQDETAKRLKDIYGKTIKSLTAAVEELKQAKDPSARGYSSMIEKILGLDIDALSGGDDMLPAGKTTNEDPYQFLKDLSKSHGGKAPSDDFPYLQPGDPPPPVPGLNGVKIHVLGPPKDIKLITETEPPKPGIGPPLLDEWTAFSLGALAAKGEDKLADDDKEAYVRSLPFEKNSPHRISAEDLKKTEKAEKTDEKVKKYLAFFQEYYGFTDGKDQGPAWRRIDTDWLTGALTIALKVNGYINNTSLVLAIELTSSEPHKVLLFVGDAQAGNWDSWATSHSDLIKRTVLYKVGHHGSGNGTLTEQVKNMSSEDATEILVTMISVARKFDSIPALELIGFLEEKTEGRVLRTDGLPPPDAPYVKKWQDFINQQVKSDPSPDKMWIQYTVQE